MHVIKQDEAKGEDCSKKLHLHP